MRPALLVSLVTVSLLAAAGPARADFINGSFESGNLSGWTAIGDTLAVTSSIGASPTQGTYQALLTTASQNGDANNFSGNDAVSAASLLVFLDLLSLTGPGGPF